MTPHPAVPTNDPLLPLARQLPFLLLAPFSGPLGPATDNAQRVKWTAVDERKRGCEKERTESSSCSSSGENGRGRKAAKLGTGEKKGLLPPRGGKHPAERNFGRREEEGAENEAAEEETES